MVDGRAIKELHRGDTEDHRVFSAQKKNGNTDMVARITSIERLLEEVRNKQPTDMVGCSVDAPREARTPNLLFRRQTLCPIELWVQGIP